MADGGRAEPAVGDDGSRPADRRVAAGDSTGQAARAADASVDRAAGAEFAGPDLPGAATPDDGDLVHRCQDGDLTAFELLLERHQDRIFNLVYRLTGHHQDAQDITQDVFLRALEHIGSFRQQAQVYTWLFRIAVNLAISRRRRTQRLRFLSLDAGGGGQAARDDGEQPATADPVNPRAVRPDEQAVQDEQARHVAGAIAELDEEFRAVLVLKDIEDFGYQEISEILELPLGTVKSRLHRARSELKTRLGPIVHM